MKKEKDPLTPEVAYVCVGLDFHQKRADRVPRKALTLRYRLQRASYVESVRLSK